jgi:hypothetical protein
VAFARLKTSSRFHPIAYTGSVKKPVLPRGASSKKKPFSLGAILFKIPVVIHPRFFERGILAFSR